MKNNEQFKRFMDSIKDQQKLDQYKAMAQQNGGAALYNVINQAAEVKQEEPKISLDAKIKEAQDKLKQFSAEHEGKVPDKVTAKLEYAAIASAFLIKARQSKGEMLDMDNEQFRAFTLDTFNSKPFKAVVDKFNNKEMYEKATTGKGQNHYSILCTAQQKYQEHEARKKNSNPTASKNMNQELNGPKLNH